MVTTVQRLFQRPVRSDKYRKKFQIPDLILLEIFSFFLCCGKGSSVRGAKEILPDQGYVADDKLVAVMQVDDVVISVHWHVNTLASAIPGVWIAAL
jgi:hypothetical protein